MILWRIYQFETIPWLSGDSSALKKSGWVATKEKYGIWNFIEIFHGISQGWEIFHTFQGLDLYALSLKHTHEKKVTMFTFYEGNEPIFFNIFHKLMEFHDIYQDYTFHEEISFKYLSAP